MGRIRSIKPEFWTSAQVVEMSPTARLLFVGLWNFSDDGGRHPASPKTLKMEVLPGDSFTADEVEGWVNEMIQQGLVIEYEVDKRKYWQVTGWHHQRIDKPTYRYPKPQFAEQSSNSPRAVGEQSGTEWSGVEWSGEELKKEKKGDFDFQSETSEMPSEKAPPVAPPPPAGEDGDDPEGVIRAWCKRDQNRWLLATKDKHPAYDASITGVKVDMKISMFCGFHAENERFQSDPVDFFKRHFKGYLNKAIEITQTAANNSARSKRNPSPTRSKPAEAASSAAYTTEFVMAAFRSRYASLADQLSPSQQRRLTEAKNETELSAWMEGMYNSLKGGKPVTRSGLVALGAMLPNTA